MLALARKLRSRWIAFVLAAVLVAAAGVTLLVGGGGREKPGAAPRGLEIGLQDNAVFLERRWYDRDLAFRQAHELGVTWLRVSLVWATANGVQAEQPSAPAVPEYDWSA